MSDQTEGQRRERRVDENPVPSETIEIAARWPWGIEPASAELVQRFEATLVAWDRHVANCRDCLHQGRWFCQEGETLTRRVSAVREMLRVPADPPRTVSLSLAVGRSVTWQVTTHLP